MEKNSRKEHRKGLPNEGKVENQDATAKTSGPKEGKAIPEVKNATKDSFIERWKSHRFMLVRGLYFFLASVWTVVMVIGGFIGWLISLLFI